jgi:hypothetical protein
VETLDLAAGLGMVAAGVLVLDAEAGELVLEQDLAAAGAASEDCGVIAEHRSGEIELAGGGVKGLYDVVGSDGGKGAGGQVQAGVIVQEVEDLDLATIGQLPGASSRTPRVKGASSLRWVACVHLRWGQPRRPRLGCSHAGWGCTGWTHRRNCVVA